jgi:signal peptidase I
MAEKVNKKKKKGKIRETIEIFLWAILIALIIRIFLIEGYRIPTQSLYPNYIENDHILVNKLKYGPKLPLVDGVKLPGFTKPSRGDIVVFENPRYESPGVLLEFLDLITFSAFGIDQHPIKNPKNFIKRCLAVPGDKVEWIENRKIKINDELLEKSEKEIFNYNDVEWGQSAILKRVDMYKETNGENTYKVQYRHLDNPDRANNTIIDYPITYYMPEKGDVLKIERKSPNSRELIYKIGDINITHLWETEKKLNTRIRGWVEIIKEESEIDLTHNYLLKETKDNKTFTYEIKHNYYFMIGDNRDNSEDGRFFGPVRDNLIIGSPFIRYFPFNRMGCVD